jgi:hypothetical protein
MKLKNLKNKQEKLKTHFGHVVAAIFPKDMPDRGVAVRMVRMSILGD